MKKIHWIKSAADLGGLDGGATAAHGLQSSDLTRSSRILALCGRERYEGSVYCSYEELYRYCDYCRRINGNQWKSLISQ